MSPAAMCWWSESEAELVAMLRGQSANVQAATLGRLAERRGVLLARDIAEALKDARGER